MTESADRTERTIASLVADARVQDALAFIERDRQNIIETQIALTRIPAPSFHEEKKAARLAELFRAEGLENVHIDEAGNCLGLYPGSGEGPAVLVEAHMDTVFPLGTELNPERENGWIYCPGITDNTSGCAALLGILRAMKQAGIRPASPILFAGTVCEEGMGAMAGMQALVRSHNGLKASVSMDGCGYQSVIYQATGIQTYEVTFHGIGGHAQAAFSLVANPIHAAGRAIAKIAEFRIPEGSETTFAVTNLEAGSLSSVHAITKEAVIRFNFRANNSEELEEMRARMFAAIDEACREETERWGRDTITYTVKHLCDISANPAPGDSPLVEAAVAASRAAGCAEPVKEHGGATNCSRALEAGIPAVCLGSGLAYDSFCHTLNERFYEEDAFKGTRMLLLTVLAAAGTDMTDSVL